ncbi:MAG: helix-turn-helix domain-containing protein [Planctomycetaceae bacterium]|nr:helix-turn-helix domain-containing protein [Planctomycetaceae bacterium]
MSTSEKTVGSATISVREAARYIGISRSKLYEMIRDREIKSIRIGASRRFRVRDLDEFLEACYS